MEGMSGFNSEPVAPEEPKMPGMEDGMEDTGEETPEVEGGADQPV